MSKKTRFSNQKITTMTAHSPIREPRKSRKQKVTRKIITRNVKKNAPKDKKVDAKSLKYDKQTEIMEFYPEKLKRTCPAKKIVLKPKHSYSVVAATNKRKLSTPLKGIEVPKPKLIKQEPLDSDEQMDVLELSSPIDDELSFNDDDLNDEDFMEILTCPSPVWWEDYEPCSPESPTEDKEQTTSETAQQQKTEPIDTFTKKRTKLENILENIKNSKNNEDGKRKISSDGSEYHIDDDILNSIENIDIPIEKYSLVNNEPRQALNGDQINKNEIKTNELAKNQAKIGKITNKCDAIGLNTVKMGKKVSNSSINDKIITIDDKNDVETSKNEGKLVNTDEKAYNTEKTVNNEKAVTTAKTESAVRGRNKRQSKNNKSIDITNDVEETVIAKEVITTESSNAKTAVAAKSSPGKEKTAKNAKQNAIALQNGPNAKSVKRKDQDPVNGLKVESSFSMAEANKIKNMYKKRRGRKRRNLDKFIDSYLEEVNNESSGKGINKMSDVNERLSSETQSKTNGNSRISNLVKNLKDYTVFKDSLQSRSLLRKQDDETNNTQKSPKKPPKLIKISKNVTQDTISDKNFKFIDEYDKDDDARKHKKSLFKYENDNKPAHFKNKRVTAVKSDRPNSKNVTETDVNQEEVNKRLTAVRSDSAALLNKRLTAVKSDRPNSKNVTETDVTQEEISKRLTAVKGDTAGMLNKRLTAVKSDFSNSAIMNPAGCDSPYVNRYEIKNPFINVPNSDMKYCLLCSTLFDGDNCLYCIKKSNNMEKT